MLGIHAGITEKFLLRIHQRKYQQIILYLGTISAGHHSILKQDSQILLIASRIGPQIRRLPHCAALTTNMRWVACNAHLALPISTFSWMAAIDWPSKERDRILSDDATMKWCVFSGSHSFSFVEKPVVTLVPECVVHRQLLQCLSSEIQKVSRKRFRCFNLTMGKFYNVGKNQR